jgi:hypothetical protein
MGKPHRYDISFESELGYKLDAKYSTPEEGIRDLRKNAKCGDPLMDETGYRQYS